MDISVRRMEKKRKILKIKMEITQMAMEMGMGTLMGVLMEEGSVEESLHKWFDKYKKSIDCNNQKRILPKSNVSQVGSQ